jgi:hypothetical protein
MPAMNYFLRIIYFMLTVVALFIQAVHVLFPLLYDCTVHCHVSECITLSLSVPDECYSRHASSERYYISTFLFQSVLLPMCTFYYYYFLLNEYFSFSI